MKKRGYPVHGWVVFDKPYGMTSTQAVAIIRRLFNAEKAGHGGTLDPLATGLLPIALGEATKTAQWAMEGEKIYHFEVTWGEERTTDDLEGEVISTTNERPSPDDIQSILSQFQGTISQTPPAFSAIKIGGERAYDLARAGETVELRARNVVIEKLALLNCPDSDRALFEVICGKGTYVRSLARDMGRRLGCLGYVSQLRRVKVGAFHEDQMISLEKLDEMRHKDAGLNAINRALHPIETVLDGIPALALSDKEAQRLRQGQSVLLRGAGAPIECDAVLMLEGGKPLGLGCVEQGSLKPKRLFNL